MNGFIWVIALSLSTWLLTACQPSDQGNATFTIDRVYPESALPGTPVKIYGKRLPRTKAGLTVRFGEVVTDSILAASPKMITAVVPALSDRKAPLRVSFQHDSLYSNRLPFRVAPPPERVPPLYWVNQRIHQGTISPRGQVEMQALYPTHYGRGLVVDTVARILYWGSYYGQVYQGSIDLPRDSSLLVQVETGLQDFWIDPSKAWLYYCTESAIKRVSLADTSRIETLYVGRDRPFGLQLADDGQALYWGEYSQNQVLRGRWKAEQAPEVLFQAEGGPGTLRAIALDEAQETLYVAETPYTGLSRIQGVSLGQPTDAKLLYETNDGIGTNVESMVLDHRHRYLYWINNLSTVSGGPVDGDIRRAPLDGSAPPEMILQTIDYGYLVRL